MPNDKYRCGYCGWAGPSGRCQECGSAMDSEDRALLGAKDPEMLRRWLRQLDSVIEKNRSMSKELRERNIEDYKEGRDPLRFSDDEV